MSIVIHVVCQARCQSLYLSNKEASNRALLIESSDRVDGRHCLTPCAKKRAWFTLSLRLLAFFALLMVCKSKPLLTLFTVYTQFERRSMHKHLLNALASSGRPVLMSIRMVCPAWHARLRLFCFAFSTRLGREFCRTVSMVALLAETTNIQVELLCPPALLWPSGKTTQAQDDKHIF